MKSSAGAILKIPVCRVKSVNATIEYLHQSGFLIVASDLNADRRLDQLDVKRPLCVVMGSEDKGISEIIKNKADELYIIPQNERLDSLNVSVATGISLYEIFRQRKNLFGD